jgi:hypothetical protein
VKSIYPFRHIHLDFHTSPLIPEIGVDFDPEEFARTLGEAGVNSICVFARCHHGMCYYPTSVGTRHPNLSRDLLGEQTEACHRHGINTTVYTTVVWDEDAAEKHPEWRQVDKSGRLVGRSPLDEGRGWRSLCMNTDYADFVIAQSEEIVHNYPLDGLFEDIVFQTTPGCVCNACVQSMREADLDPTSDADLKRHSLIVERRYMSRLSQAVWAIRPGLPLFFNSRLRLSADPDQGVPPELAYQTHLEIESLPSGGWGYNHFPLYVRYFQTQAIPHLGHTGRFHTTWGDFGGLKPRAALEYECFRMLASGSTICVGDQLHPRGRLDPGVYQRIGEVFHQAAEVEPWCIDAVALADIGCLLSSTIPDGARTPSYATEEGAMRLLLELHHQYQFVDRNADFSRYRLLIVPDDVRVDAGLRAKIDAFVVAGGALLVTGRSGLSAEAPTWETLGVGWEGPSPYAPEFLHLGDELASIAPPLDYVVYERGERVRALPGTEVLAEVGEPYFNRTPFTYSSHQYAPIARVTDAPAITRRGRAIYCAFPLFRAYKLHGNEIYRQVIAALIRELLPDPLVKVDAPSTAEVTLLHQSVDDEERLNVHLLHYVPQRLTPNLDLVTDIIPLHDVGVAVKVASRPRRTYLAPQGVELSFTWDGSYASCQIPRINGHQILCVVT